jgi:hypothetical protein
MTDHAPALAPKEMAPYAGRGARGLMLGQETFMRMVQPRPKALGGTYVLPPMCRVE